MRLFEKFGGFGWAAVERLIEPAGSSTLGIALPFEYLRVPGDRAEQTIDILLKRKPTITPVILGGEDKTANLVDFFGDSDLDPGPADQLINKANALDLDAWFEGQKSELTEYASEDGVGVPPREDWPSLPQTQSGLVSIRDLLSQRFHKSVAIALLPTGGAHHEAAAHLKIGGWNEMPDSVAQVALHKRWANMWGARPTVIAFDTIEFAVERPVKTRAEALALAMEHYLACNDIIDQGFGSLDALAASLIGAKNWYLWWD